MSWSSRRTLMWLGLAIAGLSALALVLAIGELGGGVGDIPSHWWSGLPVVGILAGVALMFVSVRD